MEELEEVESDGTKPCPFCHSNHTLSTVITSYRKDYGSTCILCISDFIDFFVQNHYNLIKDLPSHESHIGDYWLAYKDEWKWQSTRVKV